MGGAVEPGALTMRMLRAGLLCLLWLVALQVAMQAPARAADAGSPGSHSSPGGVAPSAKSPGLRAISCGSGYCDSRRHYCETIKTDVPELPSDHACMPLPKTCRAGKAGAGCGCFPDGTRCDFCQALEQRGGATGFYRTCVGGY